jgi:hypothetical protein
MLGWDLRVCLGMANWELAGIRKGRKALIKWPYQRCLVMNSWLWVRYEWAANR